jgi:hypothetical protein
MTYINDQAIVELIGVYPIAEEQNVKLIEMVVDCPPSQIDVGKITQPEEGIKESDWQAAYDEYYLNESGMEVVGRFDNVPIDTPTTHLTFFLYFVNFDKPLSTQFGGIQLPEESPMPERLRKIIKFEPVD